MRKILIVTPNFNLGLEGRNTRVVNMWADALTEAGHSVKVIHLIVVYRWWNWLPRVLRDYIVVHFDYTVPQCSEGKVLSEEGVHYESILIKRWIPRSRITKGQRKRILCAIDNTPFDIIVFHWINPCYVIYKEVLAKYENINVVAHCTNYLNRVGDVVGINLLSRNSKIQNAVKNKFGINSHIMPSHVHGIFLSTLDFRPRRIIRRGGVVSSLIKRKNIHKTLNVLNGGVNYLDKFTVVGKGPMLKKLINVYSDVGAELNFIERLAVHEIKEFMDNIDLFILISEDEAFGLVYLEAMCRGCIVVGVKNEGISGIIEDGKNGFLIEAATESALKDKLNLIKGLSSERISEISLQAHLTGISFNAHSVAEKYISLTKSSTVLL